MTTVGFERAEFTRRALQFLQRVDWWIALWTAVIGIAGYLFVRSATFEFDEAVLASKQGLFLAAGVAVVAAVLAVPYRVFAKRAFWLYALAIVLLLGLPLFGSRINGAQRWYKVFGFGIQPSEFAKVASIVALAAWFRVREASSLRDGLLVPLAITALPVGLILTQPDLGSSLVFWPVMLAVCHAAGARPVHLLGFVAVGVLSLLLAYEFGMHDYQRSRVDVWWSHFGWPEDPYTDPQVASQLRGDAYQPWQALIAIGSGGVSGQGYLQGTQSRFDFLPYRSGDYVFAVVCEELGLLGALAVLGAILALCFAILGVAVRTNEPFGRLVAVGVAAWIGAQSIMHIAVCLWLVPATGLPLPLVSHGGSSVLAAALAIGLVLNVSARRDWSLARRARPEA